MININWTSKDTVIAISYESMKYVALGNISILFQYLLDYIKKIKIIMSAFCSGYEAHTIYFVMFKYSSKNTIQYK